MAKRRHEEAQSSSSKATMAIMAVAGIAVAALVVWALTRTVQPAPSVMTEVPMAVEQTTNAGTSTLPPLDTAQNPQLAPPVNATTAPAPPVADENATVKRTGVSELRAQIDAKQVTVIDVRDKTSYINSHIPGSLHIPMAQIESQVSFLKKDKPIVTYCT